MHNARDVFAALLGSQIVSDGIFYFQLRDNLEIMDPDKGEWSVIGAHIALAEALEEDRQFVGVVEVDLKSLDAC